MVGQENLLKTIKTQIENNTFPRFAILVGDKGSGKQTLINEIQNYFDTVYKAPDVKIDTIRELIQNAYTIKTSTLFVIADADDMSANAKNSLLKLCEEPPNNAYVIMTLQDENNTLATIRSRGSIYKMEKYSFKELQNYDNTLPEHILKLCDNIGEIELLKKMGAEDFYNYVELTVNSIAKVSGANAFKIANKIAFKEEDDGYNLKLFWKAFMNICIEKNDRAYIKVIRATSEALQCLRIRTVNRQMLCDSWILQVRSVLM